MSEELERVYTINLGKVLLSANNRRATRAINMIREFARHHMKNEQVKIEEDVSHQIWSRGIKHPPRKIRVRLTKTDDGYTLVSPYEEEIESKTKDLKDKKPELKEKTSEQTEIEKEPKKIETETIVKEEAKPEPKKVEDKVSKPKKESKPEPKKETKPKKESKSKPKKEAKPKKESKPEPKKVEKKVTKPKKEAKPKK